MRISLYSFYLFSDFKFKFLILITMILMHFFLFFVRKIFISVLSIFGPFLFFFFRKIFKSFTCSFHFSHASKFFFVTFFLCAYKKYYKHIFNSYSSFFYIYTKNLINNVFIGFKIWLMYVIWITWIVFYELYKKSFELFQV